MGVTNNPLCCWGWPMLVMILRGGIGFISQSRNLTCHSVHTVQKSKLDSSTFVVALLTSRGPTTGGWQPWVPAEDQVKKLIYIHSGNSFSHRKENQNYAICRQLDTTGRSSCWANLVSLRKTKVRVLSFVGLKNSYRDTKLFCFALGFLRQSLSV